MKRFIQRTLRRVGLELRRTGFDRTLMDFIRDRKIDTILDVGANVGQFGSGLRSNGYRGKLISFEPVASVYQALAARTAAEQNWDINNYGLGDVAGPITIHVTDASVFSSILQSTSAATRHDATAAVTRIETIEMRTLDEVCREVSGNILLKIDTQGFEKQVLEGGRRMLPSLQGVLMELPIIHLYEGTWRFDEAIKFMAEAGFVPAQISPVNYHSIDTVSLVEVDCLFRPRDPRVD